MLSKYAVFILSLLMTTNMLSGQSLYVSKASSSKEKKIRNGARILLTRTAENDTLLGELVQAFEDQLQLEITLVKDSVLNEDGYYNYYQPYDTIITVPFNNIGQFGFRNRPSLQTGFATYFTLQGLAAGLFPIISRGEINEIIAGLIVGGVVAGAGTFWLVRLSKKYRWFNSNQPIQFKVK